MNVFDEMRLYVGLGDEEARLRNLWSILEPEADAIVGHFYETLMGFEGTRQVLKSDAQVTRLRGSLRRWIEDTMCSPRDAAYIARRERIGQVHVDVGLEPRYMHGAMSVFLADIHRAIMLHYTDVPGAMAAAAELCDLASRVLMLELTLMTNSYVDSRDHRRLEAFQSVLVTHLAHPVMVVNETGHVVACTSATASLIHDDPLGRPWLDVLPPGLERAGNLQHHARLAVQQDERQTLTRVDVSGRSYQIHLVPLAHKNAALLVQIEELTDALALEARVRRAESLAQLGALSAAVAHELRNPLAGIRGAIQVMANRLPEDAPNRPIMLKVEQEVDRLNALVTDLLDYARPRPPRADVLDLHDVVKRAIALHVGDIPFQVTGRGPAVGDADQIGQIVLNLLQNAVQAGASTIAIDVQPGKMQISDDGPGIESDQRDAIFEAFVTTKSKGTGLGLAISRRAASDMDGWLELTEGPLCGASFLLTLPTPDNGD